MLDATVPIVSVTLPLLLGGFDRAQVHHRTGGNAAARVPRDLAAFDASVVVPPDQPVDAKPPRQRP